MCHLIQHWHGFALKCVEYGWSCDERQFKTVIFHFSVDHFYTIVFNSCIFSPVFLWEVVDKMIPSDACWQHSEVTATEKS